MTKPTTIAAYLANVTGEKRVALDQLRQTIRAIVPAAKECISYSMPAFRVGGHVVAGFLATSKGCSYFPFSGTTLATLATELVAYDTTKSALHFDAARPLPKRLVRKLLATRIAETSRSPARSSRRARARATGRAAHRRRRRRPASNSRS